MSYLFPVSLKRAAKGGPNYAELLLSRNQFQLATTDALYSDGDRYTPALSTVQALKIHLPDIKDVLVLGAGIGSIVFVLRKYKSFPRITLVDINSLILDWATACLTSHGDLQHIVPVCTDARAFIGDGTNHFDLIFVDIFSSRIVPDFVTTTAFFTACRERLSESGFLAFNYIEMSSADLADVKSVFTSVFPEHEVISTGLNRIFLAKNQR